MHRFLNPYFNQLLAEKKGLKNGASQQTFSSSYFDRALLTLKSRLLPWKMSGTHLYDKWFKSTDLFDLAFFPLASLTFLTSTSIK
jgi:hypothetical protein